MRKSRLVLVITGLMMVIALAAGCLREDAGKEAREEARDIGEEAREDVKERVFDLEDGRYTAKTEPDEYNWYGKIDITITDGRITEVNYDEINSETGAVKGKDYKYPKSVEVQDTYEKQLLQTQDPDKVDVVTGATQTWKRFKATAKEALRMAD